MSSIPVSSLVDMLRNAVTESFETLAFADVTEWRGIDSVPVDLGECIGACIKVRRPISGLLALFLAREQCAEFVGAVNGADSSVYMTETELLDDFMKELVNTIAGRFATAVAGETGVAGLGSPSITGEWEIERGSCDRQRLIGFAVDGSPALFVVEGI